MCVGPSRLLSCLTRANVVSRSRQNSLKNMRLNFRSMDMYMKEHGREKVRLHILPHGFPSGYLHLWMVTDT